MLAPELPACLSAVRDRADDGDRRVDLVAHYSGQRSSTSSTSPDVLEQAARPRRPITRRRTLPSYSVSPRRASSSTLSLPERRSSSVLLQHDLRRPASPGISSFDGTPPQFLFAPPPPPSPSPPRPSPRPVPSDMAFHPVYWIAPESSPWDPLADPRPSRNVHYHPETPTPPVQPEPQPEPRPEPQPEPDQSLEAALLAHPELPKWHSLTEIATVVREAAYESRRAEEAQRQLHHFCIANARAARLVHAAPSVHRALAECVRAEDKHSFLSLFDIFHDLSDVCTTASALPGDERPQLPGPLGSPRSSFLDHLPVTSRDAVLSLLRRLCYDGAFIADCLAALSPKERLAMAPERRSTRSGDSVLNNASWSSSRVPRILSYSVDLQAQVLTSSEYDSPLSALVECAHAASADAHSEAQRALDVWSTVCARLVQDKRHGTEKLVPDVLDAWASRSTWTGQERLQLWLSNILQKGAFLVEQPNKLSFRVRAQGMQESFPEDHRRAEAFYAWAVDSLLELLGDSRGPSIVPEPVLSLCGLVWHKLSDTPGHQRIFPQFIATRWLFSIFLPDAIAQPEASIPEKNTVLPIDMFQGRGLLTSHFVSEGARQQILHEVTSRAHKALLDVVYPWKHGQVVPPLTSRRIQSILDRLRGPDIPAPSQDARGPSLSTSPDPRILWTISIKELVSMVNALFPKQRPASVFSGGDFGRPGSFSSSSSVSGLSLFSPVASDLQRDLNSLQGSGQIYPPASESSQATPINGDNVDPLDIDKLTTWSEVEQLREACALLEDMVGATEDWADHFACVSISETTGDFRTLQEAFFDDTTLYAPSVSIKHSGLAGITLAVEDIMHSYPELFSDSMTSSFSNAAALLSQGYQNRIDHAEWSNDFVQAYDYTISFQDFKTLQDADQSGETLLSVLNNILAQAGQTVARCRQVVQICEQYRTQLHPSTDRLLHKNAQHLETCFGLRDKMWYVGDVRGSAAYDEVKSVTAALRTMGKSKRQSKPKVTPPLRHWGTTKLTSTNLHLKTEAQILDLLSAAPDQGGPNKLSGEQSRIVSQWIERNGVELICQGEERIHKFCFEVGRCANQLTADSATIWSNPLFAREQSRTKTGELQATRPLPTLFQASTDRIDRIHSALRAKTSSESTASRPQPLSNSSSRDRMEVRSPALTNKSSLPFWSPAVTESEPPSTATSIGSPRTPAVWAASPRKLAVAEAKSAEGSGRATEVKSKLTGLLLSDLGLCLFGEGSETDRAFCSEFGKTIADSCDAPIEDGPEAVGHQELFDFQHALDRLLACFSSTCDPHKKLDYLDDINRLLDLKSGRRSRGPLVQTLVALSGLGVRSEGTSTGNTNVQGFQKLFSDSLSRPFAIFRDMQYIAALVPAASATTTSQGQAFSNAAIAILQMKHCWATHFVATADAIIQFHTNNRGHGRTPSLAQQERDSATFSAQAFSPTTDVSKFSMGDAAFLLQVTAKEGIAAAQRELGTLYLTHPELMGHVLAPFAQPREVFKEELESKWRKNQDPNRCDPTTMCVAHHWMSLSSKGGDDLAKEYLRQREEMERLPERAP